MNYREKYRKEHREKLRQQITQWFLNHAEENSEYRKEHGKKYRALHKEEKARYCLRYNLVHTEQRRKYESTRLKEDLLFKLAKSLRSRIKQALKAKQWHKDSHFVEYIGCSLLELKEHIERQFQSGMTWRNHGKWHIDHVIPLVSAKTTKELYKLCHYANLQPLWAEDNLRKHSR